MERRTIFSNFLWCFGISTVLVFDVSHSSPTSIAGTVTRTNIKRFSFFAKIANPCEIGTAIMNNGISSTTETTSSVSTILSFYSLVASAVQSTLRQLKVLDDADPNRECNQMSLTSLPATPPLDTLNVDNAIKQSYKTGIFLATHFHLMSFDRQLNRNTLEDQQENELEGNVPSWQFRRCGNETQSFQTTTEDITAGLEGLLCTILTGATEEQRASFREPINELQETRLYRYHTSCSMLQTRDCLLIREARQGMGMILRKFQELINSDEESVIAANTDTNSDDDDMMDNSI